MQKPIGFCFWNLRTWMVQLALVLFGVLEEAV
jgi:hypothetical protein